MDRDKVRDAVGVILDELNGGNQRHVAAAILETVEHEHRTLQQAFWSAMLLAQMNYADNSFDLRNECAVKLAKAVDETAKRLGYDLGLPRY